MFQIQLPIRRNWIPFFTVSLLSAAVCLYVPPLPATTMIVAIWALYAEGRLFQHASYKQAALAVGEESGYAEEQVQRARAHLEAVFDAATEVSIIATDKDGIIRLFNTGAEKMLGYRAEEVVGRCTPELIHLESEVQQRSLELSRDLGRKLDGFDVFVEAARNGGSDQREWTYVCKDGTHKDVRLVVTAVRCEDGEISGFLGVASDVTELKESQRNLVQSACFDRLTGLPNRQTMLATLQARLNSSDQSQRELAVVFLDFDRFKVVNDSLGHDVGDRLLAAIGKRLSSWIGKPLDSHDKLQDNFAARLGGDEFVVILSKLTAGTSVQSLATDLQQLLSQPYQLGDFELCSTASLGIVENSGEYELAHHMVRDADIAMYESKRAGRGGYILFDRTMRENVQRQQMLESDLALAASKSQLHLVYQPIIDLTNGGLQGVEALLRWNHPQQGPISPEEFIPIAEESGLIRQLGEWVITEGVRQFSQWDTLLGQYAPRQLFLNLAPRQLNDTNLCQWINEVVEAFAIDHNRITLELTESALMGEPELALKALTELSNKGFRIAIDDFGTGHSSLSSFHRFPVNILKLDRSFTNGIDKDRRLASMVHAIAVLAKNLGISTVGEGVETPEQMFALTELGCSSAQGYLIARPMPADEVAKFVKRQDLNWLTCEGASVFGSSWENRIKLIS